MRKRITIPADVHDDEIKMMNGRDEGWKQSFQMYLREWVFGWKGFDESTDMMKIAASLMLKFLNKKPGDEVILSETEWEKGKKALEAADIPQIFRGTVRPFRMAWYAAEDVKEEEPVKTESAAS